MAIALAAPHVAGTGALYLFRTNVDAAAVEFALKSDAVSTGTTSNGGQPITLINAAKY